MKLNVGLRETILDFFDSSTSVMHHILIVNIWANKILLDAPFFKQSHTTLMVLELSIDTSDMDSVVWMHIASIRLRATNNQTIPSGLFKAAKK